MPRERSSVACALVAAVMCSACGLAPSATAQAPDRSTITTSGTGTVLRAPDVARLRMRIATRADRPAIAQQRSAEIAKALTDKLRQLGVPDKSVQTASYEIGREYEYVARQQVFRGWGVSHALDVRVDDVARLGEILDAVESAGPITIDGPSFGLKDEGAAQAEALKAAVALARTKADAAAQGAGARVVRILNVEEKSVETARPFSGLSERAAPSAPQTPIAKGELTIEAHVTLTMEIR